MNELDELAKAARAARSDSTASTYHHPRRPKRNYAVLNAGCGMVGTAIGIGFMTGPTIITGTLFLAGLVTAFIGAAVAFSR